MDNSSSKSFSQNLGVKDGFKHPIRTRIDTILKDKGLQWVEVYQPVGLSKAYASMIRNGHLIPPAAIRIRIAKQIGCDTSVIWEFPDIFSADKINPKLEPETDETISSGLPSQQQRKQEDVEDETSYS